MGVLTFCSGGLQPRPIGEAEKWRFLCVATTSHTNKNTHTNTLHGHHRPHPAPNSLQPFRWSQPSCPILLNHVVFAPQNDHRVLSQRETVKNDSDPNQATFYARLCQDRNRHALLLPGPGTETTRGLAPGAGFVHTCHHKGAEAARKKPGATLGTFPDPTHPSLHPVGEGVPD